MSRWSPDRSAILSLLLDEVTGTEEAIAVKQDRCRIVDCFLSSLSEINTNVYFTGSKAEGLDLPGGDVDFMANFKLIDDEIQVVQSMHESHQASTGIVLCICTENTLPGFALLYCKQIMNHSIYQLVESINGEQYFSSNLLLNYMWSNSRKNTLEPPMARIQGPSIEHWDEYDDKTESGRDFVTSIHCAFWPNGASEWLERPRHFGWPTAHDISAIVNFGFHFVPVGHPNSNTKSIEWRFSFSLAEKTLVWSFNHIQMQCYAVMKIILKEFIKKNCSEQNQVLCSYFIKTFLFWKYETTDATFWQNDNFRDCIMYLLNEFRQCLHDGVIRHYFFPRFNLLSVKLTAEAQAELLQLFDIIIQKDINILKECKTLQNVWSKFLSSDKNQLSIIHNAKKTNFLKNEALIMKNLQMISTFSSFHPLSHLISIPPIVFSDQLQCQIQSLPCKTCLKSLVVKAMLLKKYTTSSKVLHLAITDEDVYQLQRIANNESSQFDLSTCKIWYAMVLLKKNDFNSTISIVNQVLSSIPSFALYASVSQESTAATQQYAEKFMNSEIQTLEKVRTAWLLDISFDKSMSEILPLALQIDLLFCDVYLSICLSPFTCLYYLAFLCHHMLGQYANRDQALRQLVRVANDDEKCGDGGSMYHTFNIVGHCLLIAGERDQAHKMFNRSYLFTQYNHPLDKYNSAGWYLSNFF